MNVLVRSENVVNVFLKKYAIHGVFFFVFRRSFETIYRTNFSRIRTRIAGVGRRQERNIFITWTAGLFVIEVHG